MTTATTTPEPLALPVPNAMGLGKAARTFGVFRKTIRAGEVTWIVTNPVVYGENQQGEGAGTTIANVELYNSAGEQIPLSWPGKYVIGGRWGTGHISMAAPSFGSEPSTVTFGGVSSSWYYQQQNMLSIPDGTWCVWVEKNATGTGVQWAYGTAFPTTPCQPLWSNVVMADGKLTSTPTAASNWTGGQNVFFNTAGMPNLSPAPNYAQMIAEFRWTDLNGNPLPAGAYTFKYRLPDGTFDARTVQCALNALPLPGNATVYVNPPPSNTDASGTITAAVQSVEAQGGGTVYLNDGYYLLTKAHGGASNVIIEALGHAVLAKQLNENDYSNCFCNTGEANYSHFGYRNVRFESADGNEAGVYASFGSASNDNALLDGCSFGPNVSVNFISDGGYWNGCPLDSLATLWYGGGCHVRGLYHRGLGNVNRNVERMSGDSNIVVDAWWNGGMQGPNVGQWWSGDTNHDLYARCRWSHIDVASGRSEAFMQEGGAMNNCLFIGCRWDDCALPFQTVGAGSFGNTFYNLRFIGPTSVAMVFADTSRDGSGADVIGVGGNVWMNCEAVGVDQVLTIAGSRGNNRIMSFAAVDRQPSMNHGYKVQAAEYVNQNPMFVTDDTTGTDTIEGLLVVNCGTRPVQSGWTVLSQNPMPASSGFSAALVQVTE
jgi:hypothetical protein